MESRIFAPDDESCDLVAAAIDHVAAQGPTSGRPMEGQVSKSKAVTWSEVRAERNPNEEAVAKHRARYDAQVRGYRLRGIREELVLSSGEQ